MDPRGPMKPAPSGPAARPAQPLSVAWQSGKALPERTPPLARFVNVIAECRPQWDRIGEQVATTPMPVSGVAAVRLDAGRLDHVLRGSPCSSVRACGIAPHIRQRLFWVCRLPNARRGGLPTDPCEGYGTASCGTEINLDDACGVSGRVADADRGTSQERHGLAEAGRRGGLRSGRGRRKTETASA